MVGQLYLISVIVTHLVFLRDKADINYGGVMPVSDVGGIIGTV